VSSSLGEIVVVLIDVLLQKGQAAATGPGSSRHPPDDLVTPLGVLSSWSLQDP
jgi:hypothetical protein